MAVQGEGADGPPGVGHLNEPRPRGHQMVAVAGLTHRYPVALELLQLRNGGPDQRSVAVQEVFSRDGAAYVGLDAEVFDQLSRGGADPDRAAHGGTKVGTLGKQTEPSMIGFVRGEELQQAMRPHVGAAGAGRGVDPDDGADGVVLEAGGEHIGSAVAETIDDQNLGALILLSAPVAVLG